MASATLRAWTMTLAIFLAPGWASLATAGEPSATGSGMVTLDGQKRTFAFSAVGHADGSVSGQIQLKNRNQQVVIHVQVDTLYYIDAKTVLVGGVVTQSSDASRIGHAAVFAARDNGEGKGSVDQMSLLFDPFSVWDLLNMIAWGFDLDSLLFPIDGGNIQVRS